MRMRDLKDALLGKTRRVEELEDALRHILLAGVSAQEYAVDMNEQCGVEGEAVEIIIEKAKQALDND